MICSKCGANIPDGSTFCTACGAAVEAAPAQAAPQPVAAQPAGVQTVSASKVLTWGILGLAFAGSGLLGLIFSIIGLKKGKLFLAENGSLFGQAKVGRTLAKVGLILSIVMMVFWVIYIAVVGIFVGTVASNATYYY